MSMVEVASSILRTFIACLIVGSTLGWFPSSVNASSTSHLLDAPVNFNLSQTKATDALPTTSQPVASSTTGTWEVTDTIQLSGTERPLQIAVGGGKAYVSRNPGHLTVLDLSTNTVVTTISFVPYPGSTPHYIGISGGKAYVALGNLGSDGQLAVVNIANNTVSSYVPVGADPHGVATVGQKVYVTNNVWWSSGDPATVKVVDTNTNSVVATIPVGINPTSVAIDPVSRKAYVTNHNDLSKSVSVIDTTSNSVTTTIPINNPPAGVAISSNRAYVATTVNMPNGTAEVIDIGSDSVASSIPIGRDSWGIAASSEYVFVANQSSDTVSVIEIATNAVVATVNVGDAPTGIAVDPSTDKVYVTNQSDRTISVIQFKETAPPSNQPPVVSITSPPNGATVSGATSIQGTASDPDGNSQLQRVEVKVDTGGWTQASGTTSWSYSWDTTAVPNGQHSIYARSYDGQAYSSEELIVVSVNNVASTPSLVDVGISSEAEAWPPKAFLQAKPGDRINTWYRISYAGSLIRVKLKTTIFDPNGREIGNPLNDPFLQIDGPTEDTGWVGVTFETPAEAITGTYDVRFSVWSEDGAQEYDALVKSGWLSLDGAIHTGTIEVTSDPSGASFTLSGPANYSDITPWSKTDAPVGAYTITWTPISGYQTPSQESKTLVQGGAISFYGHYQSGKGTIEVTSDPSGASFTLSGPANYSGITPWSKTDAPAGTYTITWAPISGYQTPPRQSKTLAQGGAISFHGDYQLSTGTIEVTSEPSGAAFTLSGPRDYSGITPWSTTDAPAGSYTITWCLIQGYETPSQDSKTLMQGGTISFHGLYQQVEGSVEVTSDPPGASFTLNGPANYSGVTPWNKTDAPVGIYTVTWGPLKGYETPSQQSKTLTRGGIVSFRGLYRSARGTIEVSSDPSGASFTLSGPANYRGTTPWRTADAPTGTYTVTWGFMSGYETPLQESKTLTQERTVSFHGIYPAIEAFPGANAATLWDYYSAWGKQLPPLSERAKMYEALGLGSAQNYAGTAEQNTRLLNALKERQICPSTGEEVGWVAPQATLVDLIQQEATGGIPVTVDGELYIILTLKNSIDPITLEVVSDSGPTKVYVYGNRNYPVSDPDIAQRIGLIDRARNFRQGVGSPENIVQQMQLLNMRWATHQAIEYEDAIAEIVGGISLAGVVRTIIRHQVWDPISEVREYIYRDLSMAFDQYQSAWKIASGGDLTDYQKAHDYLVYYWLAKAREDVAFSFLDEINEIWKSKADKIIEKVMEGAISLIPVLGGAVTLGSLGVEAEEVSEWILEYSASRDKELLEAQPQFIPKMTKAVEYTLELAQSPRLAVEVHSPVELRVYDSEQRVTGLVNGEERNEIPYSVYHDNSVTIFSPTDFYRYEVAGTSDGSYDLAVTTIAKETNTFTLTKVPTLAKAVHQYTIDWDALAGGEKGVTMEIDSDGDGTFEEIKYLGVEEEGLPWVWIAVGVLSGLVGVLVAAFMVWRHMSREQVPKG